MQAGNGAAIVAVVEQAGAASVGKVVYVKVSKEVEGAVEQMALRGFFANRKKAADSNNATFPATAVVIAATFIRWSKILSYTSSSGRGVWEVCRRCPFATAHVLPCRSCAWSIVVGAPAVPCP
jgi:hypothetical protein